jgi:hypothetical protein
MPGIGQGISEGVSNFFKMYQMGKQQEQQSKLQKIQPTLDILHQQLQDDSIPLDERKRLLNQFQHIYEAAGIKITLPKGQTLADTILPDSLLNQITDTGQQVTDEATNAVPEGTSQTDNVTTTSVTIPLQRRRGDMSQAEINLGLQRKAARGREEDSASINTARQKEYALYNFNLQRQLQDKGYTKNPEEVMEPESGRTWSVYTNPAGDAKFVPLGAYHSDRGELLTQPSENTIPVSTYNAREKAKNSGGGLGATYKNLRHAVSRELSLPEDSDEVENETAKRYGEQYAANTFRMQQGGQYTAQGVSGTREIQPVDAARMAAEEKRFNLAATQHRASVQARIDEADPDIQTANEEITSIQSQIDEYDTQINSLLKQGYEKEDDEVKAAQKEKDKLIASQNAAKRRLSSATSRKVKASKELEELDKQYNTGPVSSDDGQYSPNIQRAIQAFKNNSTNKAKGADKMTDTQIYDILVKAGRIPAGTK